MARIVTIYFVDEDFPKYQAWLEELRFRGRAVTPIGDADQAFAILLESSDINLAIIDVMLSAAAVGSDRFTRDRTDDYLQTGLALLDDLADQRPSRFPRRAALLTNTINPETYRAARECASRHGVPLLEKSQMVSPFDFGDRVEELCRRMEEYGAE